MTPHHLALLSVRYSKFAEAIKANTFHYKGNPAIALRIRTKSKVAPTEHKVCIWSPETFLQFLKDGGGPSLWMRSSASTKEPFVIFTFKVPGNIAKQLNVSRYVTQAGPSEQSRYIDGNPLNLLDCNVKTIAGFPPNNPFMIAKEALSEHLAVRMFPSWDLSEHLAPPELLDLDNPFVCKA